MLAAGPGRSKKGPRPSNLASKAESWIFSPDRGAQAGGGIHEPNAGVAARDTRAQ